jgi:hypothetical protein
MAVDAEAGRCCQVKVMFGSALLKCSEHQRPFWLTVALSVLLLASVSITIAHAADPTRLAHGLKRDFGALRAQLEEIDPSEKDAGGQSVAFNADLGDGGAAFRRDSMATIVNAASRRLERLIESHRQNGDAARARTAETLRLALYELQRQIDQLAGAAEPVEAAVVLARIEKLLDRAEGELGVLLQGSNTAAVLPAVAPSQPAAAAR